MAAFGGHIIVMEQPLSELPSYRPVYDLMRRPFNDVPTMAAIKTEDAELTLLSFRNP